MENKYRLLDMGEDYRDGDEILTVSNGWQRISGCGTVQAHTAPMRRPDDGKGQCVIVNDCSGEDYWKWGVGWVQANSVYPYASLSYVWRKPREVEKPTPPGLWVVIHTAGPCEDYTKLDNDVIFTSWQEACDAAKQQARINGDGAEFSVAHIDRTFKCVVEVVEKEVGL